MGSYGLMSSKRSYSSWVTGSNKLNVNTETDPTNSANGQTFNGAMGGVLNATGQASQGNANTLKSIYKTV